MTQNHFQSFAIVPAAGRSVRMGQSKLLLRWGTSTIIEHTFAAWRTGGVTEIFVVVRQDDTELVQTVERAGAKLVIPNAPHW